MLCLRHAHHRGQVKGIGFTVHVLVHVAQHHSVRTVLVAVKARIHLRLLVVALVRHVEVHKRPGEVNHFDEAFIQPFPKGLIKRRNGRCHIEHNLAHVHDSLKRNPAAQFGDGVVIADVAARNERKRHRLGDRHTCMHIRIGPVLNEVSQRDRDDIALLVLDTSRHIEEELIATDQRRAFAELVGINATLEFQGEIGVELFLLVPHVHGGDGRVDQEVMVFEHGVDVHQKGLSEVAGNRLQIGSVVGADSW